MAVPEPARFRPLGARSPGDHRRQQRAVRRHGTVRLPDGAVRVAGAADAGDLDCQIQGCRSRTADRFPRDGGPAPLRPRLGHESARVAARQMGGEARQRIGRGGSAFEYGRRGPQSCRRADARLAGPGGDRSVQPAVVARLPADRRTGGVRARSGVDSTARRRTVSARGFPSTSPASTGRRATASSPGS
jgi:hypothetical protein